MAGYAEIIKEFIGEKKILECIPYGNGHINDTYRVTAEHENKITRYILQKMNTNIFKQPDQLMCNIFGVTGWLNKKLLEAGEDAARGTLNFIRTADGETYFRDHDGNCWRMCFFVEAATALEQVRTEEDFYQSAVAFGRFQRLLSDYPADSLFETIPDFHNTVNRVDNLKKAIKKNPEGRAEQVHQEIADILSREDLSHILIDLRSSGELPVRVTHNDTKLNNVMIDDQKNTGICVIDLDTVMPGLAAYDFGDAIRFGANTAVEDETDLEKVSCDLKLFEIYVKGFMEGCGGALTKTELETLPLGAMTMTYENAVRFLTDYLEGDVYFKIHRPDHNLDRCRNQLALLADMEKKKPEMDRIVANYI